MHCAWNPWVTGTSGLTANTRTTVTYSKSLNQKGWAAMALEASVDRLAKPSFLRETPPLFLIYKT